MLDFQGVKEASVCVLSRKVLLRIDTDRAPGFGKHGVPGRNNMFWMKRSAQANHVVTCESLELAFRLRALVHMGKFIGKKFIEDAG